LKGSKTDCLGSTIEVTKIGLIKFVKKQPKIDCDKFLSKIVNTIPTLTPHDKTYKKLMF